MKALHLVDQATKAIESLLTLASTALGRKSPKLTDADGVREDARATPTPPLGPRLNERVSRRWHELIEAAKQKGQEVRHCGSLPCAGGACGIASCVCHCEGCDRLAALLARAHREATLQGP